MKVKWGELRIQSNIERSSQKQVRSMAKIRLKNFQKFLRQIFRFRWNRLQILKSGPRSKINSSRILKSQTRTSFRTKMFSWVRSKLKKIMKGDRCLSRGILRPDRKKLSSIKERKIWEYWWLKIRSEKIKKDWERLKKGRVKLNKMNFKKGRIWSRKKAKLRIKLTLQIRSWTPWIIPQTIKRIKISLRSDSKS